MKKSALEISNWLSEQVLFTGEPPKEIEIKGGRVIYLSNLETIGGERIADYEIMQNCLYVRVRQNCGINGWRFITCYGPAGLLNENIAILTYLSHYVFKETMFGKCYRIYHDIWSDKCDEEGIQFYENLAAVKDGEDDTFIHYLSDAKTPEFILTIDKEVFERCQNRNKKKMGNFLN